MAFDMGAGMTKCTNPDHVLSKLMTEEEWRELGNEAFAYAQIEHAKKHINEIPENPILGDFYLSDKTGELRLVMWYGDQWNDMQ